MNIRSAGKDAALSKRRGRVITERCTLAASAGIALLTVFTALVSAQEFKVRRFTSDLSDPGARLGASVSAVSIRDGMGNVTGAFIVVGAPDGNSGAGDLHLFIARDRFPLQTFTSGSGGNFGALVTPIRGAASGISDRIAVTSPTDNNDIPSSFQGGSVRVINATATTVLKTLTSTQTSGFSGFAASAAEVGDVTADSVSDIAIGAPDAVVFVVKGTAVSAGRAFVMDTNAQSIFRSLDSTQPINGGKFGQALAGLAHTSAGPFIAVGAPGETSGASANAGRLYIFNATTGALVWDRPSPQPEASGRFGAALAPMPDVNADGRVDILVGAPGEAGGTGRVYLLRGDSLAIPVHTFDAPIAALQIEFGSALSALPDFFGRGTTEVLIGAPMSDAISAVDPAGVVYLYQGTDFTAAPFALISPSSEAGGEFGISVFGADDVNGDGLGDIIVGAHMESPDFDTHAGRAYLFVSKGPGGISGVVTDEDLAGLSNAVVSATSPSGFRRFAATNGRGEYTIEGLAPDRSFTVVAMAPGRVAETRAVIVVDTLVQNVDFALPFRMLPATTIVGTVIDGNSSQLLVSVKVSVDGTDVFTSTSATGEYELLVPESLITGGSLTIIYESTDHDTETRGVTLTSGEARAIDVGMSQKTIFPGSIQGIVQDDLLNPINGALVRIQLTLGAVGFSVLTNSLGAYSATTQGQGIYRVEASASGLTPSTKFVSLATDGDEKIVDFTLVPPVVEGAGEGLGEGAGEGIGEGLGEGTGEGAGEGTGEGAGEGTGEGAGEGTGEGASEGTGEGAGEGTGEGAGEGTGEGASEGADEGLGEGTGEGLGEGVGEGATEGSSDDPPKVPPSCYGRGQPTQDWGKTLGDFIFVVFTLALTFRKRSQRT